MAMIDTASSLSLKQLNDYTQAWVERDYHRKMHRELGKTPIDVFINTRNVSRQCPSTETLEQAFCRQETRKQRRSDGTLTAEGCRFEIPSEYRHIDKICIRYARWDLSKVYMVDPDQNKVIRRLFPWDKSANASGQRKRIGQKNTSYLPASTNKRTPAPLLEKILLEQNDTGLPPAYIPLYESDEEPTE